MAPVSAMADEVRKNRAPAAPDNPFTALQEWHRARSSPRSTPGATCATVRRASFLRYVRLAVAAGGSRHRSRRCAGPCADLPKIRGIEELLHGLIGRIESTDLGWRLLRGDRPRFGIRGQVSQRSRRARLRNCAAKIFFFFFFFFFFVLRREPNLTPNLPSLVEFKALVREQFYLMLDRPRGRARSNPKDATRGFTATRQQALDIVKRVFTACGPLDDEDQARLARIAQLFGLGDAAVGAESVIPLSPTRPEAQSKAS